jgi:hypothetical protein
MPRKRQRPRKSTPPAGTDRHRRDVDAEEVVELPERKAMTVLSGDVVGPVNTATALNLLSDNAAQIVTKVQEAPIVQER